MDSFTLIAEMTKALAWPRRRAERSVSLRLIAKTDVEEGASVRGCP
jgi:hypothetical protein